ncbi:flavoprotein [Streptomyces albus]|uniref:Flavoprotein n=1 Tax=Streptomyces albus (strain ATCC 21838 / DSM 41398 / FERM P-419 / JCM 4703 / NBRC 107858) TaxID=1081613 RepID=A0A0B5EV63_STRA4|nr:flavoprotein [Streptomyces albus]AOU81027.1 flavoprotein [Streptomyces albus]AYN36731.1 flavoprotein [Streptomyces albus]
MKRPTHHVVDMAWNAWGDPAERHALDEDTRQLIAQTLGVGTAAPARVPAEEVALRPTALPEEARAALAAVVGEEHVRTDAPARLRHLGGKSTPDLLRRRAGEAGEAPDAVLTPADHEQVQSVLDTCARQGVAVVPFGGGTSVVGGVEPFRGPFPAVVSLDLRRLDALVALDTESGTATLQAGLRTPEAEELLGAEGFTLGHFPQSYEFATIGGYAATRSSGQLSAGYGRFDAMVTALKVATPRGTLELSRGPATAAGPDLRQLFLGSEGTLGVITEVTVRVHRTPEERIEESWSFPSFTEGAAAVRELAQRQLLPTSIRVSDETETFINAVIAGGAAPEGCLSVVGFEGTGAQVAARRSAVAEVLAAHGAVKVAADSAAAWRRSRFSAPYLRDALLDAGVLAETLETVTSWSGLHALRTAVTGALTRELAREGFDPVVYCHLSHAYHSGASLYFTVAADGGADPAGRWAAAKRAAGDAIAAAGGSITHHHAVGMDHRPWMEAEIGPLGVEVLAAVKQTLDPAGILNPGKLIPADS